LKTICDDTRLEVFVMQLKLILIIVIAIGVALFSIQNVTPVTVSLAVWTFEGSLAFILLLVLGLGALIAGLLSSPALIRSQWRVGQLTRRIKKLENTLAEREGRIDDLSTELAAARVRLPNEKNLTINDEGISSAVIEQLERR
jgi:lipopolysaccharide assembly protein A